MYTSIETLLAAAQARSCQIWEVILAAEANLTGMGREEIFAVLESRFQVMEASAEKALEEPLSTVGDLISGVSATQNAYVAKGSLCGSFLNKVMARAFSCSEVNASMGKIIAAPTAGSCGILPAVLIGLQERDSLPRQTVLEGLLVAGGFGAVITRNATVSGAEGGCQAECGAAAAMTAAAAVYLMGGTPDQMACALGFALMNAMGLVCDPVAGLVQMPCAQRNASQAINALLSADLALAGQKSPIPADQVISAMYETGKMLPCQLRETAQGGIAAAPAAQQIYRELFRNATV